MWVNFVFDKFEYIVFFIVILLVFVCFNNLVVCKSVDLFVFDGFIRVIILLG